MQRSPTYRRSWYFSDDPCGLWQIVQSPADIGPWRYVRIRSFRFSSWHLKQSSCPWAMTSYRFGRESNRWQGEQPPMVIGPWTTLWPVSSLWHPRQNCVVATVACAPCFGGVRSWQGRQGASFFSLWNRYSANGDSIPVPILGSRKRTTPWFTRFPEGSIMD